MVTKDKRIDTYIADAQDFAKPILSYFRDAVHKACPEATETIKWGFPHFEYQGKILCSMASFKAHCAFMFRLSSSMTDPGGYMSGEKEGMGQFGQIRSVKDLPSRRVLYAYIKEAMHLTRQGVKVPRAKAPAGKALVVPADFADMLRKNKSAWSNFQAFSYSNKKEYLAWITEAKTAETRSRRMETSVQWLEEGKPRNWKYMK